MVDAIDRLMPSQSATHQTCVFQVALGSLTPEMQLRGPGGVHIFNNSLGDPHVPWGWKPTYLGMVCVDFLPLENQIETQFRVEIFLIEYQNHFRYLAQRVGTPVFTAEAEAGGGLGLTLLHHEAPCPRHTICLTAPCLLVNRAEARESSGALAEPEHRHGSLCSKGVWLPQGWASGLEPPSHTRFRLA